MDFQSCFKKSTPKSSTISPTEDNSSSLNVTLPEKSHHVLKHFEWIYVGIIIFLFLLNILQFVAIFYFVRRNKMLAKENGNTISLNNTVKNDVGLQPGIEEMEVNELYGIIRQKSPVDEKLYAEISEI